MLKTRQRYSKHFLTVGGLLAGLGFAWTAAGAGLRQVTAPWVQVAREQVRAELLESRLRETTRRIAVRDQIAEVLLAGQLTLLEAAARFRDLDAECPDPRRAILTLVASKIQLQGRALSYDECVCRNVLEYARRWREIRGEEGEGVETAGIPPGLEAEFEELVRTGALRLPQ